VPTIAKQLLDSNAEAAASKVCGQLTFEILAAEALAADALAAETSAELHPTLEALRQILDRPDRHTIGDLAALTERMTGEMMLFNALVGGPLAQLSAAAAPAVDVNIDFLAEFLRELES
jgi:hypothetical protein